MSIQNPVSKAGAAPVAPLTQVAAQAADPSTLYFSALPRAVPADLPALSDLHRMYTYFGGDRA